MVATSPCIFKWTVEVVASSATSVGRPSMQLYTNVIGTTRKDVSLVRSPTPSPKVMFRLMYPYRHVLASLNPCSSDLS